MPSRRLLVATSLYRGLNYTDPFGLCPPKDDTPCSLGDVFSFNVSAGGQLGASFTTGLIGGEAKLQVGPVATFEVTTRGTALSVSDNELSLELKGSVAGGLAQGGFKGDLVANGPKITYGSGLDAGGVGHEGEIRRKHEASSKIGVRAGLGFELEIHWGAARALLDQNPPNARKQVLTNCSTIACQK